MQIQNHFPKFVKTAESIILTKYTNRRYTNGRNNANTNEQLVR